MGRVLGFSSLEWRLDFVVAVQFARIKIAAVCFLVARLKASALFGLRLKKGTKSNAFLEENSAVVNKQQLYDMYQLTIDDAPYSFLHINTNATDANKTFYIRFEKVLRTDEDDYE